MCCDATALVAEVSSPNGIGAANVPPPPPPRSASHLELQFAVGPYAVKEEVELCRLQLQLSSNLLIAITFTWPF